MGQAAYKKKIRISDDDGVTWHDVPATSPSLEANGDVLDDTNMANNTGYRSKLVGLIDWSVSADSNYESGDTTLGIIRAAFINRQKLKVQYLPLGADTTADIEAGFQGYVVVESFGLSGDVGDLEKVAISLPSGGALEAATT